jgi:hypothetical protein
MSNIKGIPDSIFVVLTRVETLRKRILTHYIPSVKSHDMNSQLVSAIYTEANDLTDLIATVPNDDETTLDFQSQTGIIEMLMSYSIKIQRFLKLFSNLFKSYMLETRTRNFYDYLSYANARSIITGDDGVFLTNVLRYMSKLNRTWLEPDSVGEKIDSYQKEILEFIDLCSSLKEEVVVQNSVSLLHTGIAPVPLETLSIDRYSHHHYMINYNATNFQQGDRIFFGFKGSIGVRFRLHNRSCAVYPTTAGAQGAAFQVAADLWSQKYDLDGYDGFAIRPSDLLGDPGGAGAVEVMFSLQYTKVTPLTTRLTVDEYYRLFSHPILVLIAEYSENGTHPTKTIQGIEHVCDLSNAPYLANKEFFEPISMAILMREKTALEKSSILDSLQYFATALYFDSTYLGQL